MSVQTSRGKKSSRKPKPASFSTRWRTLRPAIAVLLTVAAVVGALAALGWLGDEALRGIGSRDRYRVALAAVQCDSPPGLDRAAFLSEVRYISGFPETFLSLEPDGQKRLAEAFARHPWVESVEGIAVEPGNQVRVNLKFRTPVLAVKTGTAIRLVDGHAVLLPATPLPAGIAQLGNEVPEPGTASGQVWDNAMIKRAVELVTAYSPVRLERRWTGWRLEQRDGTVLIVLQ